MRCANAGVQCYERARTASDDKTKLRLLHRAADLGNADAQFTLSSLYSAGQCGLHVDFAESVRFLKLAAAQGHGGAQTSLGVRHFFGNGVPVDYAAAVRLYRLQLHDVSLPNNQRLTFRAAIGD